MDPSRGSGLAHVLIVNEGAELLPVDAWILYSRSPKVGNPIASILKSNVKGIPALFGLNPVSNFTGFTVWFGVWECRSLGF